MGHSRTISACSRANLAFMKRGPPALLPAVSLYVLSPWLMFEKTLLT